MATKRSQRIGIWVIAGIMLIGTIGGFIAMVVAPGNAARDQAALDEQYNQWIKAEDEWLGKINDRCYPTFSQFTSRVGEFNAQDVSELKTEDLLVGSGDEVNGETKFATFYVGWTPDGEIFDQSVNTDRLDEPIEIDGLSSGGLIKGWIDGLVGMKIGGVRELTIPADLAYGESGTQGIPPNTPLKFIVMAIPPIEDIPMPQVLKDYYKRLYGVEI